MAKDYENLATCLVPMDEQIKLTMEERVQLLRNATRKFRGKISAKTQKMLIEMEAWFGLPL